MRTSLADRSYDLFDAMGQLSVQDSVAATCVCLTLSYPDVNVSLKPF